MSNFITRKTYQLPQNRSVTFFLDYIECKSGKRTLKEFHIHDDLSLAPNKKTLEALSWLNEDQRADLVFAMNDFYRTKKVAKSFFEKAGLSLPEAKSLSTAQVINFPSRYIKKDMSVPENIIDTKNMNIRQVFELGSEFSPVAFHSNKVKITNIETVKYRWEKRFGKVDKYTLRDIVETAVFLCNGHTVHFNLHQYCDRKNYVHHIFYKLARIGCKAVRGSKGRSNSFISALDIPQSLKDFVATLPEEYVNAVLEAYDNVYAYEVSKTKGIVRSKNKDAVAWEKAVREHASATEDKVIEQYGKKVSLSHTVKVSKGKLNRETVKGIVNKKTERHSIKITSTANTLDSIVEIDTCGAYLNQLRMMSGLEAVGDPYNFLDTDRDTAKTLCLRLMCGSSRRQAIRHLKDDGCDPLKAEELVDTFLDTYKPFKKCWEVFNHQQQLVMTEMYRLATQYKMAFIPNCDGILTAKSDALLAKVLYQKAWFNVTGKEMKVKIKCQDYEEQRKAAYGYKCKYA